MKRIVALLLTVFCVIGLCACNSGANKRYDLGNSDRAMAFYDTYQSYVEKYGEAQALENALCGAAVVRLLDFTGDSQYEMLIAYSSEKGKEVDRVMVCGFDMGLADLLDEEITSKDSGVASLWIYTDSSGLSYLVKGDELSKNRTYLTYQQADKEGKPLYQFAEAFSTEGTDLGGTYEKINLTGNTDTEAVFETNEAVITSLKNQRN
ncbi:MAG: hypothetical protein IJZ54_05970 [Clostridia bacterium]|nr:hypothetical protein [Clostridia bacterium]